MRAFVQTVLAATTFAAVIAAQSPSTLTGYAANTGAPSSAIIQQNIVTCPPPSTLCTTAPPAPATFDYNQGGFAYDPIRGDGAWVTNGQVLWFQPLVGACAPTCTVPIAFAQPFSPLRAAGGLTVDVRRAELAHVESSPGLASIRLYSIAAGLTCPTPLGSCTFTLPWPNGLVGGIAYDIRRDIFYVAASTDSPTVQNSFLIIPRGSFPSCTPPCQFPVPTIGGTACSSLAPLRALAYDTCSQRLYYSTGRITMMAGVAGPACPQISPGSVCCILQSTTGQIWHGFDIRRLPGRPLGAPCTSPPCAVCPTMALGVNGNPVIGNLSFSFSVTNAPTNGSAFLFLSNSCMSPGLPIFCGQLYLAISPPWPVFVASTLLPGGGACGGSGTIPLPIPANHSLCNVPLCAQAVVTCPAPGGLGLTPAFSLVIQ